MPRLPDGRAVRPAVPPPWVAALGRGAVAPGMPWAADLAGCGAWHLTGCSSRKAKSPDPQNWAETVAAVARWLREADAASGGRPAPRNPGEYWGVVARLSAAAVTRCRAARILPLLEARGAPDWPVYCWMWCFLCLEQEDGAPPWFVRRLDAHPNSRIAPGGPGGRMAGYIAMPGDWRIAARWAAGRDNEGGCVEKSHTADTVARDGDEQRGDT